MQEYTPPYSSVAALIEAKFGVRVAERENPELSLIQNAPTLFLRQHPGRVAFVVVNLSANDIYIAPNAAVATTLGLYIAPSGGFANVAMDTDFTLPTREWYGIAGAINSQVYILSLEIYGVR